MGRPKTYNRDDVLRQIVRTFWARGYAATSIRELVEATEVVPKSLYAEFGSKEELFLAAIDTYVAAESARIREHLARPPLGLERLHAYYRQYDRLTSTDGCLLVNSLAESASSPPAALARVHAFFDWLQDMYRQNLAAALGDGSLAIGSDIDSLAAALVAFDQGLAIASRSPRQREALAKSACALVSSLRQGAFGASQPVARGHSAE
jgi:TetR/AcrR family transcriptional regulator, transcriptional repressor for nem operon